jgi:HSP20 family protein
MNEMSEKEKKEKVEIKEPEEKAAIEPAYPRDIFESFDQLWEDFRREFHRLGLGEPWAYRIPYGFRGRPWALMPSPGGRRPMREADADLADTGKEYQVHIEVPGIPKDRIDVTVTKDYLEIHAKAEAERGGEEKGYIVRERNYAEIYKRLSFPEEVIPEKAEATLKDGLLEIRVPKKTPTPEVKKHKVEVL